MLLASEHCWTGRKGLSKTQDYSTWDNKDLGLRAFYTGDGGGGGGGGGGGASLGLRVQSCFGLKLRRVWGQNTAC